MSAYTFTAPLVTPEEEKAEREALTDEEKKRLEDEVYGKENDIEETEDMQSTGIAMIQDAIEAIPASEKSEYNEALQRVPDLVETESPYLVFLRASRWDSWAAARQLVDHWRGRVKIFGRDKAFLPMTLDGAMAEEVPYLETAIVVPAGEDHRGRAVVFLDRVRCTREIAPREHAARCWWYLLHTLSENEIAQKRGFIMLASLRVRALPRNRSQVDFHACVVSISLLSSLFSFVLTWSQGYDLYKHYDRILSRHITLAVHTAPVAIKATHIASGTGSSVVNSLVLPVIKHMVRIETKESLPSRDKGTCLFRLLIIIALLLSDRLESTGAWVSHCTPVPRLRLLLILKPLVLDPIMWI